MTVRKYIGVVAMLLAAISAPAAAQEDMTRTGAEVLEESFEDVGTDFDVLIEKEREDILNQRGTGGIGDDILVDGEDPDERASGTVSLEDLVDFEVSVRGIPMPPAGGGSSGSESGDPGTSTPQSGGQSGEQGQTGQQGGEQGEGEGEGEGEGGSEGGEGGEQEGQEQGQQSGGGSGGGAGAPGGEQRSGGGGGGQGDTSPDPDDIPDGQDDDIIARQLRELAENESDPELREKLWEEYRRYKAGQ